jgi:hypothetical protein
MVYGCVFRADQRSTERTATANITNCEAATPATVSHATAGCNRSPTPSATVDNNPSLIKLRKRNDPSMPTLPAANKPLRPPSASPMPKASPAVDWPKAVNARNATIPPAEQTAAV